MRGSDRSSPTRRRTAATVAGAMTPPGRPVSTTIWWGASGPGPIRDSSSSSPLAASVPGGVLRLSPLVTCRPKAGIASASITVTVTTRIATGRRMMMRARFDHGPASPLTRRSRIRRGITRRLLMRWPSTDRSAGSSVTEAAIETSGISTPPAPIERMNGSGMNSSAASPMATVRPENRVARPAVLIVVSSASWTSLPELSSSRKRNTTSIE